MQKHLNEFFANFLSKFEFGFWQGFNAQHWPLVMIKNVEKLDVRKSFCCCLQWPVKSLRLYPTPITNRKTKCLWFWYEIKNRKQKTKIRFTFSKCLNVLFGVAQGSLLWPLLFQIFIADLFYSNYDLDFESYADDTTPYICGQDFSSIIKVLEPNVTKRFNWFQ